jgi:hypothetical protein
MPPTLPLERPKLRLETVNTIFLPFLKASRQYRRLLRILGRQENPATVIHQRDYTVNILTYTMPVGPHLVIALYASTQTSRPLSPQQFAKKLQVLKKELIELRGKYFNQADIVYLIYAPAGFTRGTRRLAARQGVNIASNVTRLARLLAHYLKTRYERLHRKLLGKRVWGPIPLLLYALALLANSLGAGIDPPNIEKVLEAATRGTKL